MKSLWEYIETKMVAYNYFGHTQII